MNQTQTPARKPFQPPPDMITAAETLYLAMAYEQTVRPIVEAYRRKILAERQWEVDPLMRENDVEYILDIRSAWLMSKDDHAAYRLRCNEERIAAKLESAIDVSRAQDDYCPLLVAEDLVRQARFVLCDAMAGVTGIPGAKAVTLKSADYDHLVDLTLKVLAPFVDNPLPKIANEDLQRKD